MINPPTPGGPPLGTAGGHCGHHGLREEQLPTGVAARVGAPRRAGAAEWRGYQRHWAGDPARSHGLGATGENICGFRCFFGCFFGLDVEYVNLLMRNVENGGYWSTFDI